MAGAYWMPDWSGPLLCREIRKRDPNTPILFCTEASNESDQHRAISVGTTAYLGKPIEQAMLTSNLRALLKVAELDGARAEREAEGALQDEFQRRATVAAEKDAAQRAIDDISSTARCVERTARARAFKAFISSGGTRAHFERWWAQLRVPMFV